MDCILLSLSILLHSSVWPPVPAAWSSHCQLISLVRPVSPNNTASTPLHTKYQQAATIVQSQDHTQSAQKMVAAFLVAQTRPRSRRRPISTRRQENRRGLQGRMGTLSLWLLGLRRAEACTQSEKGASVAKKSKQCYFMADSAVSVASNEQAATELAIVSRAAAIAIYTAKEAIAQAI